MQSRKLFEDRFSVTAIDPNNKTPFRNVSRVHMKSQYDGIEIEVDINTQIYPIISSDSFYILVTSCENVKNVYSQEQLSKPSEKDNYEYVSYGVVFNLEQKQGTLVAFASFGGLLMRVAGKVDVLSGFRKQGVQSRILLMIRKV